MTAQKYKIIHVKQLFNSRCLDFLGFSFTFAVKNKAKMAIVIRIKRGLDINLIGKAAGERLDNTPSGSYAIVPDDFVGITPKAVVRADDRVKAGEPLMIDKGCPEIKFVSPVSGTVTGVNRGEKRKILSITVQPDEQIEYKQFEVNGFDAFDAPALKALLLEAGMWPFIRQRPYDRIANPSETPRDIFVTAYNSAPLAPDFEYVINGEEDELRSGLEMLTKLTSGKVYLGIKGGTSLRDLSRDIEVVELYGPHPVGNAGIMINKIKPDNKGETVWTLNAPDVIIMGRLLKKGIADFTRIIALTGSALSATGYVKALAGCTIASLLAPARADSTHPDSVRADLQSVHPDPAHADYKSARAKRPDPDCPEKQFSILNSQFSINSRLISGNVLTGKKIEPDGYLGFYDNQVTVIPEGDDVHEFIGWAMPGFNKFSVSRTYFSWLLGRKKEYEIDARIRGGKRAIIMSNEYDKVFPMDILPEYLLKAIIAFDIDRMEQLGIYEVAPEDFALCEFVDTSKIEIQTIVRNGLDLLYKEMS